MPPVEAYAHTYDFFEIINFGFFGWAVRVMWDAPELLANRFVVLVQQSADYWDPRISDFSRRLSGSELGGLIFSVGHTARIATL